jgi:hypothetical protein
VVLFIEMAKVEEYVRTTAMTGTLHNEHFVCKQQNVLP